jgi:hypothetical protein
MERYLAALAHWSHFSRTASLKKNRRCSSRLNDSYENDQPCGLVLFAAFGQRPVLGGVIQVSQNELFQLRLETLMTLFEFQFLFDGVVDEHTHVCRRQLGVFVFDTSANAIGVKQTKITAP